MTRCRGPRTKTARILRALKNGCETAADVEVDLEFTLSRHLIAAFLAGFLLDGTVRKVGEFGSHHMYRYALTPRGEYRLKAAGPLGEEPPS